MAPNNPSLGVFAQFPPEVRVLIWKNFRPEGKDGTPSQVPKAGLSVLRTSRQLYNEVSTQIYSKCCLILEISPIYQHDRWIDVHCPQFDREWKLRDAADAKSR